MIVNPVISIAKKEILDNIRNKWIIIISFLFAVLTLLVSFAGSMFSTGWRDLGLTVDAMSTLVQYIISIIALVLGYSAIIGEIEKGSMSSLLSLPATKLEILIGKMLGLSAILSLSILIGFGIAGVVIGINVPDVDYVGYIIFIAASIFMGLIFLSLGLFLSCLFKKRSTAMGGAIFVWVLYAILWIFLSAGLLIALGGITITDTINIPDWYFTFQLLNPLTPYATIVSMNVGTMATSIEYGIANPSFYTNEVMITIMLAWVIVPIILAYLLFRRRDI